ncbi:ABC transporter substrate-binding protein [Actinomycetes bacterium KLBMP 9797]
MRRSPRAAGLALCATLALTACSSSSDGSTSDSGPDATPQKGGTVYFLANAAFSHLDPAMGFDGGVNNFFRLIYRTLTMRQTSPEGTKVVPDLATDLGKSSPDAKTWTFTLKDNLFFEDGTPITSQDVKYGVSRAWDPEVGIGSPYAKKYIATTPAGYQGPYRSQQDLTSIETPDDKTIVFHLNQPMADFASVVSQNTFTPIPRNAGVTAKSLDTKPIASGPYKVESFQQGASIAIVRNDKWDASTDSVRKAYPDKMQWTFGLDGATMDQRMIAGQGDDANAIAGTIQASSIAQVQTPQLKSRTVSALGGCTTYMGLNTTRPNLKDVRVRQAISYAVNKMTIRDATGGPLLADVANRMLPPGTAGAKDFNLYPSTNDEGDVAKAKELLAQAGLPNGFTFTLDIRNQPKMQSQAEAVQEALLRVGIQVKLNIIDTATYYETIGTRSQQHDAAITGWCPDWPSGATFLPPLFDGANITDKGNSNLAQLNDPAVNQRIAEIANLTKVDEQNTAYGELDEQILKLAPVVPLLFEKVVLVVGSNIGGLPTYAIMDGGTDLTGIGLKAPAK